MTGEANAVHVDHKYPVMLSGATIAQGMAKMLVIAVGEESQYGILFKNLQAPKTSTPLEDKLDALAGWIGWGGLGSATAIFVVLLVFWIYEQVTGQATIVKCISSTIGGTEYTTCSFVLSSFSPPLLLLALLSFALSSPLNIIVIFSSEKIEDLGLEWSDLPDVVNFAIIAITIVVVAVPEGLPLAVTLSLAFSMKQMMNDNCLVRRLAACETMGGATNICSDKTGTLTENRMTVVEGWVAGKEFRSLPPSVDVDEQVTNLLTVGIAVNSKAEVIAPTSESRDISETALPTFIGNKTECALLVFASSLAPSGWHYSDVRKQFEHDERVLHLFNFTSDRKRMSTIVSMEEEGEMEHPYRMFTKGASETILERSSHALNAKGEIQTIDSAMRDELTNCINRMADSGLRTIGIAYKDFDHPSEWEADEEDDQWEPPEDNLIFVCLVGIEDPVRPEVPHAVRTCQQAGICVRMVTGDNIKTATKIARDCGILTEGGLAMEGPQFRAMSNAEIDQILPRLQVLARSIPTDKQKLVERLRANNEVVAVTGDGTNDGPALKAAHVGLAMGLSGTDVAKQASDIVILDDNFKSIVLAVMWGRCVYDNIKKFLQFQLTVNFSALIFALIAAGTQHGTPLNAVQLLWVNLIMDTMAALALGTEKPTPELLQRKPYGLQEKLPISSIMWRNILFQSLYQVVVLCILLYSGAGFLGVEEDGVQHFTIIFNTFVWLQIFNEINCRKVNNELNVFKGLLTNYLFIGVIVVTIIGQILMVEVGGKALKTTGITFGQWMLCIGFGALSVPLAFVVRLIPVEGCSSLLGRTFSVFGGEDRQVIDTEMIPLTEAGEDDEEDSSEEDDEADDLAEQGRLRRGRRNSGKRQVKRGGKGVKREGKGKDKYDLDLEATEMPFSSGSDSEGSSSNQRKIRFADSPFSESS
ncbi:plasma membrane calcium, variant 2 [Balamuthia mandrillaris]